MQGAALTFMHNTAHWTHRGCLTSPVRTVSSLHQYKHPPVYLLVITSKYLSEQWKEGLQSRGLVILTDISTLLSKMAILTYTLVNSICKIPLYHTLLNTGYYQIFQTFGNLMSENLYFVFIWIS